MSADPHGCGNDTFLPICSKLYTPHSSVSAYPASVLSSWTSFLFASLSRWGILGSAGCNYHPLSLGSEHSFSGAPDSLQSPQEQRKSTEHHTSVYKWYELQYPPNEPRKLSFIRVWEQSQVLIYLWWRFHRPAGCNPDCSFCRHSKDPGGFVSLGNPSGVPSWGAGVLADGSLWPHL